MLSRQRSELTRIDWTQRRGFCNQNQERKLTNGSEVARTNYPPDNWKRGQRPNRLADASQPF